MAVSYPPVIPNAGEGSPASQKDATSARSSPVQAASTWEISPHLGLVEMTRGKDGVKTYYVYIASNRFRTVFYTGVTNDLQRRIQEHKTGEGSRFTSQYRVTDLLYYEEYRQVKEAIAREKEIKRWRRQKKLDLVHTTNPDMVDLAQSF